MLILSIPTLRFSVAAHNIAYFERCILTMITYTYKMQYFLIEILSYTIKKEWIKKSKSSMSYV